MVALYHSGILHGVDLEDMSSFTSMGYGGANPAFLSYEVGDRQINPDFMKNYNRGSADSRRSKDKRPQSVGEKETEDGHKANPEDEKDSGGENHHELNDLQNTHQNGSNPSSAGDPHSDDGATTGRVAAQENIERGEGEDPDEGASESASRSNDPTESGRESGIDADRTAEEPAPKRQKVRHDDAED